MYSLLRTNRFVSGFMYATFNTNELRMPLFIVGIIWKTFPLLYYERVSKAFEFMAEQLTKYVFYDCLGPTVIAADFCRALARRLLRKISHRR
jgi:hypothetical protein